MEREDWRPAPWGRGRSGWAAAHSCASQWPGCGPCPRLGFAARGRCGLSRGVLSRRSILGEDARRGGARHCARGTGCRGRRAAQRVARGSRDVRGAREQRRKIGSSQQPPESTLHTETTARPTTRRFQSIPRNPHAMEAGTTRLRGRPHRMLSMRGVLDCAAAWTRLGGV